MSRNLYAEICTLPYEMQRLNENIGNSDINQEELSPRNISSGHRFDMLISTAKDSDGLQKQTPTQSQPNNAEIVPNDGDSSKCCFLFSEHMASSNDENIVHNLSSFNNLQTEIAKVHESHLEVDDEIMNLPDQAFAVKYEHSRSQDNTLLQTHNFQCICLEERDLNNISIPESLVTNVVNSFNINEHAVPSSINCSSKISYKSFNEIVTPENFYDESKDYNLAEKTPAFDATWDSNNDARKTIASLINEPVQLQNEFLSQSTKLQEPTMYCESNMHETSELSMSAENDFHVCDAFTTFSDKSYVNSITKQLDCNIHANFLQSEFIGSNILHDSENLPDTREIVTSRAPIHLESDGLPQLQNLQDFYISFEEDKNTSSKLSMSEQNSTPLLSNIAAPNNETNVNTMRQSDNGNVPDEKSLETQQFINNYLYPQPGTSRNSNTTFTNDTNMPPIPSEYDSLINNCLISRGTESYDFLTRLLFTDSYNGSINNEEFNEIMFPQDVNTEMLFQSDKTPGNKGDQQIIDSNEYRVLLESETSRNADISFVKENKNVSMSLNNNFNISYNETDTNIETSAVNSNFAPADTTFLSNKEKSILSNPPVAEKIMTNSSKISFDMETEKEAKQLYACSHCSNHFAVLADLEQHVLATHKENVHDRITNYKSVTSMRTHSKGKPYSCEICKEIFGKKIDLKKHLRVHTKEMLYACEICKKAFPRKYSLLRHIRTHSKEKPYICEICKEAFSQKCHLRTHLETHSKEKQYTCELCKKAFSRKDNLKIHMRSHSKENPYACDICKKGFSHKYSLIFHSRTHTKENLYTCKVCKKVFSQKRNSMLHARTHTKEKPYACVICKKAFSWTQSLKLHMRNHNK